MSQIWCHDCKRNIPPSKPRVVYEIAVETQGAGVQKSHVYVCGDCEYERQMKSSAWK